MTANVRDFGAKGDGIENDYEAFLLALAASRRVYVPEGRYRIAQTLHLRRQTIMYGDGGGTGGGPSTIVAALGVPGIVVHGYDPESTLRADHSVISDLSVSSTQPSLWLASSHLWNVGEFCRPHTADGHAYRCTVKGTTGAVEPTWPGKVGEVVQDGTVTWVCVQQNGVELRCRAVLERVGVSSFAGHGIAILGNSAAGTNANNWSVRGPCRISGNLGDGVHARGIDANAGVGLEIDASHNGGVGIRDASMLGNEWNGCHVEANHGGAFRVESQVAVGAAFISCYSEGGQPGSWMACGAQVFGGMHGAGFEPGSLHVMFADFSSALTVRVPGGATPVLARVGVPDSTMTAFAFGKGLAGEEWRLRLDVPNQRDGWSLMRSGSDVELALTNPRHMRYPHAVMPLGAVVGAVALDTNASVLTSGNRRAGDQWLNPAPAAGGHLGKVCVRGGWAAPKWASNVSRPVGARVVPTVDNGCVYECVEPAAGGSVEPAWSTTPGAFIVDGDCTWVCGVAAGEWSASTAVALDAVVGLAGSPFVWRCVVAGVTGATPPAWQQSDFGVETADGSCRWRLEGWRAQAALWRNFGAIET